MKRIITCLFVIIMVLGVSGCMNKEEIREAVNGIGSQIGQASNAATEKVIQELEIKYGCDFVAIKIGGRIDSGETAFYISPKENPALVFKAVVDDETLEISDNYIERIVAEKFVAEMEKRLTEKGLSGSASALFISDDDSQEDDPAIALTDYIEKYKVKSAFVYLALDKQTVSSTSSDDLLDACKALSNEFKIQVAVSGAVIGDKYKNCAEDMKKEPDVNATWFDSYSPSGNYQFAVTDGKSNISKEKLDMELTGE